MRYLGTPSRTGPLLGTPMPNNHNVGGSALYDDMTINHEPLPAGRLPHCELPYRGISSEDLQCALWDGRLGSTVQRSFGRKVNDGRGNTDAKRLVAKSLLVL